jgi:hypothetical protein
MIPPDNGLSEITAAVGPFSENPTSQDVAAVLPQQADLLEQTIARIRLSHGKGLSVQSRPV